MHQTIEKIEIKKVLILNEMPHSKEVLTVKSFSVKSSL